MRPRSRVLESEAKGSFQVTWSNSFANKRSQRKSTVLTEVPLPGPLLPPDLVTSLALGVSQPPCTPNRARGHSTHTSAPDSQTEARVAQSHRARSLRTRPAHLAPWCSQAPDGELAVTDLGGSQAQVGPAGPGAQPWPETPAPSPRGHSEQRCRTSPSNTPPITRFALGSAHGDIPMSPT